MREYENLIVGVISCHLDKDFDKMLTLGLKAI